MSPRYTEPVREDDESDDEWERRLAAFNAAVDAEIDRKMEDCE